MSDTVIEAPEFAERSTSYLTDGSTLRSWLLTTDHKRIAILYFATITIFFFIGGGAAALLRYNLIVPQGMIGSAETYNRLFTLHGVVMVWFFLVPAVPVTLGNFLVPLMLGARDLAFPRLNLLSWYCSSLRDLLSFMRCSLAASIPVGPSTLHLPPPIPTGTWCRPPSRSLSRAFLR
jgi:heme/copper-type cytochrome/quinol oxidase subunit 1